MSCHACMKAGNRLFVRLPSCFLPGFDSLLCKLLMAVLMSFAVSPMMLQNEALLITVWGQQEAGLQVSPAQPTPHPTWPSQTN